jgi:nicotinate-nucleotide adenylyltransferase
MQPIGIFGGTFDPIHCGHLRTAFELWQELRLAEVRLLPAGTPPHRDQLYASAELRLQMVRAAVADQPSFIVDDREVRRTGVSYSVDTLTELRREYPERSLCLLLGMDAFLGLPHWHRWRELLGLAHIVVAHRPGWRAPTTGPLGEVMVDHGTGSIRELHTRPAGRIYVHAGTQLEISSTELRALLVAGRDPRYLVPEEVRQIILDTRCYASPQAPNTR